MSRQQTFNSLFFSYAPIKLTNFDAAYIETRVAISNLKYNHYLVCWFVWDTSRVHEFLAGVIVIHCLRFIDCHGHIRNVDKNRIVFFSRPDVSNTFAIFGEQIVFFVGTRLIGLFMLDSLTRSNSPKRDKQTREHDTERKINTAMFLWNLIFHGICVIWFVFMTHFNSIYWTRILKGKKKITKQMDIQW